jgi:hypothetical protein
VKATFHGEQRLELIVRQDRKLKLSGGAIMKKYWCSSGTAFLLPRVRWARGNEVAGMTSDNVLE